MIHRINSYKEYWCWNNDSDTSYCFLGTKYSTLSNRRAFGIKAIWSYGHTQSYSHSYSFRLNFAGF